MRRSNLNTVAGRAGIVVALAACRDGAALVVVSAEEVGVVARPDGIVGRDGGPSALAFGRSVWTYGDTVLAAPDAVGTNWHTNSFELRDPADWATTFETPRDASGAPTYLIPLSDDEAAWDAAHAPEDCPEAPCGTRWALWPSMPLFDAEAGRAWFLFGLYEEHHPSGIGVASWDGLDAPVVRHSVDGSGLLFPEPEREWSNAPVVHDGHLWAFGCERQGWDRPCALARVPLDAVDQRDAWRFFDGEGWSADARDAADLFDGAPIMSVSWVPALDRWLLVYSGAFSRDVEARTAPELVGPWSGATVLFTSDGDAHYDVVHHPDCAEDDGATQWITWSRSTGGWFDAEHVAWRVELAAAR